MLTFLLLFFLLFLLALEKDSMNGDPVSLFAAAQFFGMRIVVVSSIEGNNISFVSFRFVSIISWPFASFRFVSFSFQLFTFVTEKHHSKQLGSRFITDIMPDRLKRRRALLLAQWGDFGYTLLKPVSNMNQQTKEIY